MFLDIPPAVRERMAYLENRDFLDRQDGTPRLERLRQVPPETGRFIALLEAAAPPGEMVEIGTSGGYSALWLALACRLTGRCMTTFELLPAKAALARETFALAETDDVVRLIEGDARDYLAELGGIAFCFLDAEKDVYPECYELVVPRLAPGGFLVADNIISHQVELAGFVERVLMDERVDALVVPVGKGLLVCRKA